MPPNTRVERFMKSPPTPTSTNPLLFPPVEEDFPFYFSSFQEGLLRPSRPTWRRSGGDNAAEMKVEATMPVAVGKRMKRRRKKRRRRSGRLRGYSCCSPSLMPRRSPIGGPPTRPPAATSPSLRRSSPSPFFAMSSVGALGGAAAPQRYFSHQCDSTINLTPSPDAEIAWPICHDGFLEEFNLPDPNPSPHSFFSFRSSEPFFLSPSPFSFLFSPSSSPPARFNLCNPSDLAGLFDPNPQRDRRRPHHRSPPLRRLRRHCPPPSLLLLPLSLMQQPPGPQLPLASPPPPRPLRILWVLAELLHLHRSEIF